MVRHGVRRLVVVEAGSLAGVVTLDDLTSRGGAIARRELLRPDYATGTPRAADDRLREGPDHRVRAGAVARQLGLEERAEEERVLGELERPRRAVLVVGAEDDARPPRACAM